MRSRNVDWSTPAPPEDEPAWIWPIPDVAFDGYSRVECLPDVLQIDGLAAHLAKSVHRPFESLHPSGTVLPCPRVDPRRPTSRPLKGLATLGCTGRHCAGKRTCRAWWASTVPVNLR